MLAEYKIMYSPVHIPQFLLNVAYNFKIERLTDAEQPRKKINLELKDFNLTQHSRNQTRLSAKSKE